jgi:hypothetical protein
MMHLGPEMCRMLPGLNAAAVGLITAAVFQLSFSVRANSPTPVASTCIGALPAAPCAKACSLFLQSLTPCRA